jgi:hypothetical protein
VLLSGDPTMSAGGVGTSAVAETLRALVDVVVAGAADAPPGLANPARMATAAAAATRR